MKEIVLSIFKDIILSLDALGLSFVHNIAIKNNIFVKLLSYFFTLAGEKCILILVISFILIINKKTRKYGICMIFAVLFAYVINNIIIKYLIMRPRPYVVDELFNKWFLEMGDMIKTSSSFPSGHTAGVSAALFALSFYKKKFYYYILAILMSMATAFSRLYFVVHYPSDCIVGFIEGIIVGYLSYIIVKYTWLYLKHNKQNKIFNIITSMP